MTDKWQGGKTYVPGSLVIPTASTAVEQLQPANAAFESGDLTSWSTTDATHWTVTNVNPYEGTYSVQVTGSALTQMHSTTTPSIKVGQTVSVSALAEITNYGTDDAHFQVALQWLDASGNFLPGATGVVAGNEINGKGGSWKLSTASGTAPAGAAKFTILLSANPGTHGSTINIDATAYAYAYAPPNPNIIYKATQADPAKSASTEPDWPGVVGVPITDGGVTWEGVLATRVVWEASPILRSGATEPTWPTEPGAVVHDGNIDWIAITSQITDANCPNSKVVAIMASKVFAADKDIVRFSATVNPLDWTSTQDAGYLPTGLQQANSNDMAVLAPYRSNLTAFNASSFQNWQVDPDPSAMALLDQMDGVGSTYTHAAQPVGNDLYYLSQLGVRSVGIANATTNLQAGDVGLPIDVLVQEAMRIARLNDTRVMGSYYPSAGQYWLAFKDADALTITGSLPDSAVGDAVNYSYTISGGVGTKTATIISGALPTGLTMDSAGVVTGTATTLGNFSWTVSATDVDGNPALLNDSTSVLTAVTWDPAQKSAYLTLSNSNLTATNNRGVTSGDTAAGATLGRDAATANHYFEVLLDLISGNRGFDFVGIAAAGSQVLTNGSFGPGRTSDSWGYRANAGYKMTNNNGVAYGAEYFTGDVVGVLLKAGKLYFRLNGTWIGDPVAETGYAFSGLTGTMYPAASTTYQDDVFTGRFRSSDLTGSLPTGTVPWGGL